ncbi:hypothetical protein IPJ72_06980 [Candidatus Peregrinibacteria bacterium]|nr:MAG: hypothetical protein IPJ72_06980 [Candidatus Peregrinibacteria bacterium]
MNQSISKKTHARAIIFILIVGVGALMYALGYHGGILKNAKTRYWHQGMGIAFELPSGYQINQNQSSLAVMQIQTDLSVPPAPEFMVFVEQDRPLRMENPNVIIEKEEDRHVGSVPGFKYLLSQAENPQETCQVYRWQNGNINFHFQSSDCQESAVMDQVIQSLTFTPPSLVEEPMDETIPDDGTETE